MHRLLLVVALLSSAAHARITGSDFLDWLKQAHATPQQRPADIREKAARLRYVFVGGFFNEAIRAKFRENVAELVHLGVPKAQIHTLGPSSLASVEDNAGYVRDALVALAARGPQPLVVVGFSKGAAESLAALVSAPAKLREKLRAVFLLQGALGGSPLADYVYEEGHDVDEKLPFMARAAFSLFKALGSAEKMKWVETNFGFPVGEGLRSLTKRNMTYLWERVFARHRDGLAAIADRVYHVRGHDTTDRMPTMLWLTSMYLGTYYGANDGVLTAAGQTLPVLGEALASVRADHLVLTGTRPSKAAKRLRVAFTDAIARAAAYESP